MTFCHAGRTGHDAVASVPSTRWDASDELDARARYGAFLPQIELFDHMAFGLPPAEADVMDPHQRLALEEGYAALSGAGEITTNALEGLKVVDIIERMYAAGDRPLKQD